MKPFNKRVTIPILLAFLVWSAFFERGGIFSKSGQYIHDAGYLPAEASCCADYIVVVDGIFCLPADDFQPTANSYEAAAIEPDDRCRRGGDAGQGLFIMVEITDECKDGLGACAPGGYGHNHEVFLVPEGATHPTKVLELKPVEKGGFLYTGGPYSKLEHGAATGVDYDFIPTTLFTSEQD